MKKYTRHIIAILVAFTLTFLTACGNGSAAQNSTALNPKKPTTITLWHYYTGKNEQAIETAVYNFNQSIGLEKGIVVESLRIGEIAALEEEVNASAKGVINSKPMPDIFSCYPDVAFQIDQYGKLLDLSPYFSEEEKAGYVSNFLDDGYFSNNRLLLVPIAKSTELIYLNETSWEDFATAHSLDYSPLSSWESIYTTAQQYYSWTDAKTPDIPWDGTALLGFDSVANFIVISNRQLGVEIIQADGEGSGKAILDQAVLRKIFDIYYPGMVLGYLGSYSDFRSDDIKKGALISYVGSSSGASYFPSQIAVGNSLVPIEFTALPYPTFNGGTPCSIQQGAGMAASISDAAHQEGAAEFLRWFTSEDENLRFAMTTGYLPVQQSAYTSQTFTSSLEELRGGDDSEQIVAKVYDVAFNQITKAETYAAKPFETSYDIRSILQASLMDLTSTGIEQATPMKAEGLPADEILAQLDQNAQFNTWISNIQSQLEDAQIPFTIK